MSSALLVVTGVDTNAYFYFFKRYISSSGFVAIQNGVRTDIATRPANDLRSQMKRLSERHGQPNLDRMLSLGTSQSLYYPTTISHDITPVGSLRNNSITFSTSIRNEPKVVSFISQVSETVVRTYLRHPKKEIFYMHGQAITAEQFLKADLLVCKNLASVCHLRGWTFQVIGRTYPNDPLEAKLFFDACQGFDLQFCEKFSEQSPYQTALASDVTVSISSTLGYELLSRGHRVVFLNSRMQDAPSEISRQYLFGYPQMLGEKGFFWSSDSDCISVGNLIDDVLNTPDDEWLSRSSHLAQDLVKFDPDNKLAKTALEQILCLYR